MAKNGLATKKDIKGLKADFKKLENKFDGLKSDFNGLKSEVLDMKVEIVSELKNMREEHDVHQFSHRRINDELQEHGKRIKKLETAKI